MLKNAEKWYLQRFKSDADLINYKLKGQKPFSGQEMKQMKKIGEKFVKKCEVR